MLIELFPHLHLDDAGCVVAHQLLQVLEGTPHHDENGHGNQGRKQRGESRPFMDDMHNDDPCDRETGNARAHCKKPEE